jgi:hypothetical protein
MRTSGPVVRSLMVASWRQDIYVVPKYLDSADWLVMGEPIVVLREPVTAEDLGEAIHETLAAISAFAGELAHQVGRPNPLLERTGARSARALAKELRLVSGSELADGTFSLAATKMRRDGSFLFKGGDELINSRIDAPPGEIGSAVLRTFERCE